MVAGFSVWVAGLLAAGVTAPSLKAGERLPRSRLPLIYHFHVPKTGGLSFRQDLQSLVPRGRHRVISKNECFRWAFDMGVNAVTVTMVRRPEAHVLSMYAHCRANSAKRGGAWDWSFEEYLRAWAGLEAEGWDRGMRRRSILEMPLQCFTPVNSQSHHFVCRDPYRFNTTTSARAAIRNLQSAWFVGLTDLYQESLCLLYARVYGALPDSCDSRNHTAWGTFPMHHSHRNAISDLERVHVTGEMKRMVAAFVAEDVKLYAAAKERFLREVGEVERRFGRQILSVDKHAWLEAPVSDLG